MMMTMMMMYKPIVVVIVLQCLHCMNAEVNDKSLNFLVIGDWGGLPYIPFTTEIEKAVARQMGKFAAKNNVEFVLALGDNFYYDGVKDSNDPRFKETYDHVFSDPALGVNWYFVAGNHDHHRNVTAQIEYHKYEKRWNFPTYYYPLQFSLRTSPAVVDVIMIDTVILCGNSDHDDLGLQPKGPEDSLMASKQLLWIEEQLKASRAEYLIVAGHYPIFSISKHGPTECLVDHLLPLLHKYNVSAYFCGHDHNLQHLTYTLNGVTVEYFVSGAANFIDTDTSHKSSVPPGSSKFFWADASSLGGFAHVQVSESQMSFSFYAANSKHLYSKSVRPRTF